MTPIIVDAHEDLAWNMLTFGRDYTRPASETRRLERSSAAPVPAEDTLLGWREYQRGRVAVVFATVFAAPIRFKEGPWDTLVYTTPAEAERIYHANLDAYERLANDHPDRFRLLLERADLESVLEAWARTPEAPSQEPEEMEAERQAQDRLQGLSRNGRGDGRRPEEADPEAPQETGNPVGLALLLEGAEGVRAPSQLEEWWARGLRMVGPAWMSGNRFCGGNREPGPLTKEGYALLEAMGSLGFGLDISHMDEQASLQSLDAYEGPVMASHSNAKALLKGLDSHRFLTDSVIRGLIERDGVIGIVPFNMFLKAGWKKGERREGITLQHVVAHIDYVCQMAGDARHVGLGTDFDGGYGVQSVPEDVDSIGDLQKLAPLLAERGYSDDDIAAIFGQNWLNWLRRILR